MHVTLQKNFLFPCKVLDLQPIPVQSIEFEAYYKNIRWNSMIFCIHLMLNQNLSTMRSKKSVLTSFILMFIFSMSVMAQSEHEVIAVINKADWCPVCRKNVERAMKASKD